MPSFPAVDHGALLGEPMSCLEEWGRFPDLERCLDLERDLDRVSERRLGGVISLLVGFGGVCIIARVIKH